MNMSEYSTLDPKSMKSMRIGYLIITIILEIAAVACFVLRGQADWVIYAFYVLQALALLMLVITIAFPRIYYDHYRYFISEDRVDVRRGIFFLTHTVVPIERIHQVEVVEGPVNRLYGLADVQITTAGGVATIEYLEKDEADRIADELNVIVDRIVRGQRQ